MHPFNRIVLTKGFLIVLIEVIPAANINTLTDIGIFAGTFLYADLLIYAQPGKPLSSIGFQVFILCHKMQRIC